MTFRRVVMIIMEILAAIMGIMSAVGGSCPAFNPGATDSEPLHTIMTQYQWIFIVMNILTYIAAIATVVMLVALFARKTWFYTAALWTAILGFGSGLVPYLMIALNGGFTPSIMRTIIYAIVIILLLFPGFRKDLKDNIAVKKETDRDSSGGHLSAYLFFPGLLIWLQTYLVAPSHIVEIDFTMAKVLQIGTGLVLMSIGILIFTIYKIKDFRK